MFGVVEEGDFDFELLLLKPHFGIIFLFDRGGGDDGKPDLRRHFLLPHQQIYHQLSSNCSCFVEFGCGSWSAFVDSYSKQLTIFVGEDGASAVSVQSREEMLEAGEVDLQNGILFPEV